MTQRVTAVKKNLNAPRHVRRVNREGREGSEGYSDPSRPSRPSRLIFTLFEAHAGGRGEEAAGEVAAPPAHYPRKRAVGAAREYAHADARVARGRGPQLPRLLDRDDPVVLGVELERRDRDVARLGEHARPVP